MNIKNLSFVKNFFYNAIFFIGLFFFDRLSKYLVLNNLRYKNIAVFKGLNFTFVLNRGVSFGFLGFSSPAIFYFLTGIIFLVISFFTWFTISEYKRGVNVFWYALIIAGAYSNLLDRILYKGVVDFIDCYVGKWHWATFNIADILIVMGVLGILIRIFKSKETFNDNVYFKKN